MDDPNKIIIEIDETEQDAKESVKKDVVRVLQFRLSSEHYCVAIDQVKEVITIPEITRVPLTPEFVVGVINLRGEIICVLDIRNFFSLSEIEKTGDARIIISDVTGSLTGILVDRIEGTVEIDKDTIQAPLATLKEEMRRYTTGQAQLGDKIVTLLDLEKIFHSEAIESLRKTII